MRILLAFLAALFATAAEAQQTDPPFTWGNAVLCAYNASLPVINTGHFGYVQCDNHGQLLSTATFTGSISFTNFTPSPAYASPLAVGATSSRVALPSGTTVIVYNTGSYPAYVKLGDNTITADTTGDYIAANSWLAFAAGTNTYLAAIETAGATSLNISGGTGVPSGAGGGGGSSGGGGGGNVAVTSPVGHTTADTNAVSIVPSATASFPVTGTFWQATQPVSIATMPSTPVTGTVTANLGTIGTAATAANQTTGNTALTTINTTLGSPMQNSGGSVTANAGTNLNTSLLATDAHLTTLGTSALATDAHLTSFTSANHADLTALGTTSLGTDAHLTETHKTATSSAATKSVQIEGVAGGTAVPVSGSFSLAGFAPGAYVSPMAVTSSSSRTALPAGATVVIYNVGSNNAYVTIGNTSVTATTSNDVVYPNCWISYSVGANVDIAAITSSSTTTLNLAGGTGIPSGGCAAVLTGASTVTANQGTAGGSAWPVSLSSLPALSAGAATIGAVSQASAPWQVQSNSANLATHTDITTLGTSALATDAHLTALGTTNLATDAHLTAFTSANHTDTTGVTSAVQALGTGALATDAHLTALGTSALATDAHLTTFTSANHTDLNNVYTAVTSPIPAQTNHNVLIGAIEGNGSAGSSDTHVVTVQGIAGGTAVPVSGTLSTTWPGTAAVTTYGVSPSSGTVPATNSALTSINAHAALEGAGAAGNGAQRVVAAQDTTTIAGSAPGTAGSASANVVSVQGIASMTPVQVTQGSYPTGATAETASATGTTAATTATLAATSGKTTYICGFSIRANATAAATGNATVTGTITGTMNFTQWTAPLASGLGVLEPMAGQPCIPASATNTTIAVVSAAPGAGGTVSVTAWGYQQ